MPDARQPCPAPWCTQARGWQRGPTGWCSRTRVTRSLITGRSSTCASGGARDGDAPGERRVRTWSSGPSGAPGGGGRQRDQSKRGRWGWDACSSGNLPPDHRSLHSRPPTHPTTEQARPPTPPPAHPPTHLCKVLLGAHLGLALARHRHVCRRRHSLRRQPEREAAAGVSRQLRAVRRQGQAQLGQ